MTIPVTRPDLTRIPQYFHRYVNAVKEDNLESAFRNQRNSFVPFLESLSEEKRDFRYAEGKWTIREMLQHIIDAERVFSYRAMCIARKDETPLPSFDENAYADNSKADKREWASLLEEYKSLRIATEILFSTFDKDQLETAGTASGKSVYVLGIGFIIVGHINHHVNVIRERYLS